MSNVEAMIDYMIADCFGNPGKTQKKMYFYVGEIPLSELKSRQNHEIQ